MAEKTKAARPSTRVRAASKTAGTPPAANPRNKSKSAVKPKRGRQTQQRSLETRQSIEEAALLAFSELGFEGASTIHIAHIAGVSQQLVIYHYKTKLMLWKSAANLIFGLIRDRFDKRITGLEGVSNREKLPLLAKEFIRFSAEHPELVRFISHENRSGAAHTEDSRHKWLVETHIGPLFKNMITHFLEAQKQGIVPAGDPVHLLHILLGSVTMFSNSADTELITGRNIRDSQEVEAFADLVLRLLAPGSGAA